MKCTPRGSTTTSESFVVCGPNPERRARRDRRMAWRVGERRWYEEREEGKAAAAPLQPRGRATESASALEWSSIPPVEVLFHHCDNSNNAGLTGTVHEGTKARARGGMSEGSRVLLPSLSQCRNDASSRSVPLALSIRCTRACFNARLFAEYRRSHPLPFVSHRKYRDIVCERAHRKLFSQAFSHAVMWQNSAKVCTRFWVRKASLLNKTRHFYVSVNKRNFAAQDTFVINSEQKSFDVKSFRSTASSKLIIKGKLVDLKPRIMEWKEDSLYIKQHMKSWCLVCFIRSQYHLHGEVNFTNFYSLTIKITRP